MTEDKVREVLERLGVEAGETNASGWVACKCPYAEHGYHASGKDDRPSFFVYVDNSGVSGYNCFTCHQTGTLSQLVRKLSRLRGESMTELAIDAELYDTPDEWGDYEQVRRFEEATPIEDGDLFLESYSPAWDEKRSRDYLLGRRVSQHTSEVLGLRYDEEAKRIIFPVLDYQNRLYGLTGRSIIPDARMKVKDYLGLKKEQLLLGEHLHGLTNWSKSGGGRKCLVVEGLFALAHFVELGLHERGITPIATMGAHMSQFQADGISDLWEEALLLYDDDLAGDVALYGRRDENGRHLGGGAVDLLNASSVNNTVLFYPERTGDPDDITEAELDNMLNDCWSS